MRIESKLKNYYVNYYDDISRIIDVLKSNENSVWVIDENIYDLYNKYIPTNIEKILFESNEKNKSWENVGNLLNQFNLKQVKSDSTIIAIGGGTLQDAVGFCCSIYNRGIKWNFIPTTLLAQADSCIGGKTSINFSNKKNVLGTFYPPNEILICTEFLKTLPQEQYNSGMGEIIKFHILCDSNFDKNKNINDLITWSLNYKAWIIEKDEFDKNHRKNLNYGHTFGHALESISNYSIPHGIAVLVGILIANRYANNIGILTNEREQQIQDIIKPFIKIPLKKEWFDYNELIKIVKSDKKNTSSINMILLRENYPILLSIQDFLILEKSVKETYEKFES